MSADAFEGLVQWLTRRYGDEIGPFLARRMGSDLAKNADPCIDALRAADTSNDAEMMEFKEARSCCGSFEREITHFKSGRTFVYGFNYGH